VGGWVGGYRWVGGNGGRVGVMHGWWVGPRSAAVCVCVCVWIDLHVCAHTVRVLCRVVCVCVCLCASDPKVTCVCTFMYLLIDFCS